MWSTPGCDVSGAPVSAPVPVTTLQTPSGRPASLRIFASSNAVNGVCSAGLATTVQPAASAGAKPRAAVEIGKFHGMICAVTPTGS